MAITWRYCSSLSAAIMTGVSGCLASSSRIAATASFSLVPLRTSSPPNDSWPAASINLGVAASFALAAKHDLVKGFAVGRTIFAEAARQWLKGEISDEAAIADMVGKYENLCRVWDAARAKKELAA